MSVSSPAAGSPAAGSPAACVGPAAPTTPEELEDTQLHPEPPAGYALSGMAPVTPPEAVVKSPTLKRTSAEIAKDSDTQIAKDFDTPAKESDTPAEKDFQWRFQRFLQYERETASSSSTSVVKCEISKITES